MSASVRIASPAAGLRDLASLARPVLVAASSLTRFLRAIAFPGSISSERLVGPDRGLHVAELGQCLAQAVGRLEVVGLLIEQLAVLPRGLIPAPGERVRDCRLCALLS